jgi:PKD repeat protein
LIPLEVVVDASASTAPEGTSIAEYHWCFGNGDRARGRQVTYIYENAGEYMLSLTVITEDRRVSLGIQQGIEVLDAQHIVFRRGDSNTDSALDISDAIFTLSYLFADGASPSCGDAADSNDDGVLDIADAIAMLSHLFAAAGDLPAPFGQCGIDPTVDELGCLEYAGCQ